MKKIIKLVNNPFLVYNVMAEKGLTNWMSDKAHLRLMHRAVVGVWPNLDHPQTFNEKLQWLKIHDHNPLYTMLVDKLRVKEWVAARIGAEHVTQTYAVWDRAEDIDISELPERFVLKTNHDCGGIARCNDRRSFSLEAAKAKLAAHLRTNYFWRTREWPYKDVKPCVFAEEYVEPDDGIDLEDYKLFHFSNGRIVTLHMTNRFTGSRLTETFFDEEWKPLELTEGGYPTRPDSPKPIRFDEMKAFTNRLAEGLPFARVDFYETSAKLLFGEFTLYPNAGFERFDPVDWDVTFGSWIEL